MSSRNRGPLNCLSLPYVEQYACSVSKIDEERPKEGTKASSRHNIKNVCKMKVNISLRFPTKTTSPTAKRFLGRNSEIFSPWNAFSSFVITLWWDSF